MSGFTTDLELVGTTQRYTLGTKIIVPSTTGDKTYVYVKSEESFGIGDVVARAAGNTDPVWGAKLALVTNFVNGLLILGVAGWTIASGSYGFVQCGGKHTAVKCGTGDITLDLGIISGGSTAGKAKAVTAGTDDGGVFGVALATVTTNDSTFAALLRCPGAYV